MQGGRLKDPLIKEREAALQAIWRAMKHKCDVEDVFMDSKVDGQRIYQT